MSNAYSMTPFSLLVISCVLLPGVTFTSNATFATGAPSTSTTFARKCVASQLTLSSTAAFLTVNTISPVVAISSPSTEIIFVFPSYPSVANL